MVAYTPKYSLPVEETDDPSDMPTATARQAAAVEKALDRVKSESVSAANAAVAGLSSTVASQRVSKGGDIMTGNLTINKPSGHTQLILQSVGGGWVIEASSTGTLFIGTASVGPNTAKAVLTADRAGNATFPASVTVNGATTLRNVGMSTATMSAANITQANVNNLLVTSKMNVTDAGIPVPPTPIGTDQWRWLIYMNDGQVRRVNHTLWTALVQGAAGSSSATLKTDIADATDHPDIRALAPRKFAWIDETTQRIMPGERYGLIAEEVAEVDPRLAMLDESGAVSGLDQHALIAALIEKVQTLEARIETLEAS